MNDGRWQGPIRFQSADGIKPTRDPDREIDTENDPASETPNTSAGHGQPASILNRRKSLAARIAFISLTLLIISIGGLELFRFVEFQLASKTYFGWLVTGLMGFLLVSSIMLITKQLLDLRRLKRVDQLRNRGEQLIESHEHGSALAYCASIAKLNSENTELTSNYAQFESRVLEFYSDSETLALFSREYMHALDMRCYRLVEQHAKQVTLYTALSPFAILDALLALWRNMRMLREISAVYGGRPGASASFMLARKVLHTMLFIGASDLLADATADALGRSVLSAISTQAAQGLAAGLFTARVGLKAMSLCRPMPFGADDRPSMKALSRSLFNTLKPGTNPGQKLESR